MVLGAASGRNYHNPSCVFQPPPGVHGTKSEPQLLASLGSRCGNSELPVRIDGGKELGNIWPWVFICTLTSLLPRIWSRRHTIRAKDPLEAELVRDKHGEIGNGEAVRRPSLAGSGEVLHMAAVLLDTSGRFRMGITENRWK